MTNWKAIEGFPHHEVSRDGRVRNVKRGRELCQSTDKGGYRTLELNYNGRRKTFKVHRLVAIAYIPNPLNLPEVNHLDEDKANNFWTNLEWCTAQYNCEYSKSKNYKLISPNGEVVNVFNLTKFARDNNLTKCALFSLFNKNTRLKSHKGWRAYE
jgi:hypothetical protein